MGLLNFESAPIEPKSPTFKKGVKLKVKGQKTGVSRQRVDPSSVVYGEQLFKSSRNVEKEIVVCFHPFTSNYIRVEKEGRFAIHYKFIPPKSEEWKEVDENIYENGQNQFTLYHFLTNIEYEYIEREFNIEIVEKNASIIISSFDYKWCVFPQVAVETFGPFETVLEIRDIILRIIKQEYLEKKAKKLANLRAVEAEEKLNEELKENEQLRIENELAEAGLGEDFQSSQRETEKSSEESGTEEEIHSKEIENENKISNLNEEIREPTASFLTKDAKPLKKSFMNSVLEQQIEIDMVSKPLQNEVETFAFEAPDKFEKLAEIKPKTAAELWMEQFSKGK